MSLPQRGASPVHAESVARQRRRHLRRIWNLSSHLQSLPWRLVLLHGALFSFWVLVLGGAWQWVVQADRPISGVVIEGDLRHVSRVQLEGQLQQFAEDSFFTLELDAVKAVLMKEPWLERIHVQRQWPDQLQVSVSEHEPLAFWNQTQLLGANLSVFEPDQLPELPLPALAGPENLQSEVWKKFTDWSRRLLAVDENLIGLELDDRGAWTLRLQDNTAVELGRSDVAERFGLLLEGITRVRASRDERMAAIDMRYTRGMAVRWSNQEISEVGVSRLNIGRAE